MVSRSSAEAEYRAVANAVAECCWLRNQLRELHVRVDKATVIYSDNISAVYLSENPVHHQRTKHVELDILFVHQKVQLGLLRVLQVPSRQQFADIMTKGLPSPLFQEFMASLCIQGAQTEGGGVEVQVLLLRIDHFFSCLSCILGTTSLFLVCRI